MVFTWACKIIPWGPIICLKLASSLWKMQNYNKKKSFDKKLSFLHGHARHTLRAQKVPKVGWSVVKSVKFWKNLFQRKLWFLAWTWKFIPWGPKKCLRWPVGHIKHKITKKKPILKNIMVLHRHAKTCLKTSKKAWGRAISCGKCKIIYIKKSSFQK